MSTAQHDAEVAEKQGKERGLSGGSATENPHGRTARALAVAWHKGYVEGLAIRESQS